MQELSLDGLLYRVNEIDSVHSVLIYRKLLYKGNLKDYTLSIVWTDFTGEKKI